jgi:phosphatidylserine/phosphatidylglycerophosphate/cardiolipin synthase-like enzyme
LGKKLLSKGKYLRKIEFLIIVLISFSLYFMLKEEPRKESAPKITEPETVPAQAEPEKPEIEEKAAVYFDRDVQPIVEKMIKSAEKTIDAATYTYSKNEVTELLEKRAEEGVKVRLAAGKNKDKTLPSFDFSLAKTDKGIYHPKFFVFDDRDVLILSANISSSTYASNNAVLFKNVPEAAAILKAEIDDVFAGKIEKRCADGCITEIGTIIFNPGKGCVKVRDEFLAAEKSIKGAVYTVTQKNPLITGLKKAVKSGIQTQLIIDNWRGDDGKIVNKKAAAYLESIGVNLKYDEQESTDNRLFHHKFAEIDGITAIFGSMNWTASACYRNREIIVISKDQTLAASFAGYFDKF